MTRIMSTLEANNDVGLLGQPVDDFPLPFVPHWEPTTTTLAMRRLSSASLTPGISSQQQGLARHRDPLWDKG